MKGISFITYILIYIWLSSENFAISDLDEIPTYEQFEKKISRYPYYADTKRVAKVVSGFSVLKMCMDKKQIQYLIGTPDFGDTNFGPKGPSEKWIGTSWTYYFIKQSSLVNINDSTLEIFFDTKNRAHWIVPNHIDGLSEIGAVSAKCL